MAKETYRVTFKEQFNKDYIGEFKDEQTFEKFLMLNYSTKKNLDTPITLSSTSKRKAEWFTIMPYIFQRDDARYVKVLIKCSIEVGCNFTVHTESDAEYVARQIAALFGKTFEECKVQKCYWNDIIFFSGLTFKTLTIKGNTGEVLTIHSKA